jgi:cell division protein FtsW (lipid II flippase)
MSPFDNVEFCSCITGNMYFKVFVAVVLGLVLTFAHDLPLLQKRGTFAVVFVVFLLLLFMHLEEELGSILLLFVLLMVMYNTISVRQQGAKAEQTSS